MGFGGLLKTGIFLALAVFVPLSWAFADETKTAPWSMADEYWGAEEMKRARDAVQKKHGAMPNSMIMADRLEWQSIGGDGSIIWDAQGWYGGDVNKFYVKTEGEFSIEEDDVEDAEIQTLWSRAVSPFWDMQAGVRYDLEPKGRTHAVLGIQGLAPYWFEIDAAVFLSTAGDFSARVEAEYDLRLSQNLIIQPRGEIEFSVQDIPSLEIGSGVTGFDAGLRLRYEIKREFAPYVGVEWQKTLGDTADFARAGGSNPNNLVFITGIRAWF